MRGEEVRFTLETDIDGRTVRHEFTGRIEGDAMRGTAIAHGGAPGRFDWQAMRAVRGTLQVSAIGE